MSNALADVKRRTTRNTADKDLLDGFRTAFAPQKIDMKQRASTHTKDQQKLTADEAASKIELRMFRDDLQTNVDRTHTSLESEMVRASAIHSERVRLLVSEESHECQLQRSSDDSEQGGT